MKTAVDLAEEYHKGISKLEPRISVADEDMCLCICKIPLRSNVYFQCLYYDANLKQHYHINEYEDGSIKKRYLPAKNFSKRMNILKREALKEGKK